MKFSQLKADRKLAQQVAGGNGEAFDAFFKEYFPRLFRFTMTRTNGDADLSEEIVQQTMCKVVRKIGSYRGEALLFTWLCQICRNELADQFRRRGSREAISIPFEDVPEIRAAWSLSVRSQIVRSGKERLTNYEILSALRLHICHSTTLQRWN